MVWNNLTSEEALSDIKEKSGSKPVVIFKHSTRCSISSMALSRLERSWNNEEMMDVEPYFLDLIAYRSVSNKVAEVLGVPHESPQLLLIIDGKCIYNTSHMGISYNELKSKLQHIKS
jgi:bacillithiol system protein YtxJ